MVYLSTVNRVNAVTPETLGPTRALARFVVTHRETDLTPAVRTEATRSLLNWVGCAVGGSRHDTVERALAALAPFSGAREATVLGRGERLDPISVDPWQPGGETWLDRAVGATRRATFPLLGLDPDDPRD